MKWGENRKMNSTNGGYLHKAQCIPQVCTKLKELGDSFVPIFKSILTNSDHQKQNFSMRNDKYSAIIKLYAGFSDIGFPAIDILSIKHRILFYFIFLPNPKLMLNRWTFAFFISCKISCS